MIQVNEILERKRVRTSVFYRSCFQQQADVASQVEQVKLRLQDPSLNSTERRDQSAR